MSSFIPIRNDLILINLSTLQNTVYKFDLVKIITYLYITNVKSIEIYRVKETKYYCE